MTVDTNRSTEPSIAPGATIEQPPAPDADASIQVDSSESNESDYADSTLGDDVSDFSSTSITSSIYNYPYLHGRRYHSYHAGKYPLPNDEAEQDRLDLQHHIYRLMLDGRLFRAPISTEPRRVLDFGTGTGIWAIEFADQFPMTLVIGTDLSPIQPNWVPPNLRFYVDDVENDWVELDAVEGKYDYIHGRSMAGSIKDWGRLYRQAFQSLNPGGWIEMQEYETWYQSDDDPDLTQSPYFKQCQEEINKASKIAGKELNLARQQKLHLIDAGFVDVKDDVFKVPLGTWPRDPKLKELGKYQLAETCSAILPFCLGFLARYLNWTEEECRVLAARVVQELQDRRNHLYTKFHFVYGYKPDSNN